MLLVEATDHLESSNLVLIFSATMLKCVSKSFCSLLRSTALYVSIFYLQSSVAIFNRQHRNWWVRFGKHVVATTSNKHNEGKKATYIACVTTWSFYGADKEMISGLYRHSRFDWLASTKYEFFVRFYKLESMWSDCIDEYQLCIPCATVY